jgi:phosphatidylinositol alpha-mannosyltransferase
LRVVGAHRDRAPAGVEVLGRVSDEEKRSELAAATVLAAPNLGGESFGIILIEAMAAGCAVVASDLDAFRAVAGGAGVMVEVGDAAALAAGVGRLLADPAAAQEAARAGQRAVEQYDWSSVTDAYVAAYRDAVAAAG